MRNDLTNIRPKTKIVLPERICMRVIICMFIVAEYVTLKAIQRWMREDERVRAYDRDGGRYKKAHKYQNGIV